VKKNPNQITDEELLKLLNELEDSDEEAEYSFDSTILSFVQSFKLQPGKDRILKKQLFRLYRLWNRGIHKLDQYNFTREITHYIPHKNDVFLVDKSLLQIADFVEKTKKRTRDKYKSKKWREHFTAFLEDTKLEEGTYYIELEIIYFLYQQWRRKTDRRGNIGRRQFIKILDLYFDVKAIAADSNLWVGVNEQIKNLITKSEVERWRKTRAKDKKRKYYPKEEWKQFALYWEEKTKES
jgi:hypothetical protein